MAFVAMYMMRTMGVDLNDLLGLHYFLAPDFHIYQLFTYMFMHASLQHIFFNMFALWMFGCVVENVWGPRKFLFFYLVCGVGAGLMQELAQTAQLYYMASAEIPSFGITDLWSIAAANSALLSQWTTVGASGAIYAVLLAFGMTFPEERIFIFPLPIPIKAKWFVMLYVGIELFSALGTSSDGVAHFAHLGGMLFGYLLIRHWNRHPNAGPGYGFERGEQFFSNLRSNWERRSHKQASQDGSGKWHYHRGSKSEQQQDWDYNERKKKRQEEVDRILDKIRRSGYDSLSKDEKQTLFDSSKDD